MDSILKHLFLVMLTGCMLLTLSSCGTTQCESVPVVVIDLGKSMLYTQKERNDAVLLIREKFATFAGCELHDIRYVGDEVNNDENLRWLNSLREVRSDIPPEDAGKEYTEVAEFLSDFHSPVEEGPCAWNPDEEYIDYQWWLARTKDGKWEIVSWGY